MTRKYDTRLRNSTTSEERMIFVSSIIAEIQKLGGLTLAKISEKIGVSMPTVRNWSAVKSRNISSRAFDDLERELNSLRKKEMKRLVDLGVK